MTKLLSFASILLGTISKCVSEDSKKMIKSFAIEKYCRQIFQEIYFFRIFLNHLKRVQKKCITIRAKKKIYQNIFSFYFKKIELNKKGFISSKTSYICSCSDFRLTNRNHLYCNYSNYVSFYASYMLT